MSFGTFEMLEAGNDAASTRRTASNRALSAALVTANNEFGAYLANSTDHDNFIERLAQIRPDLEEVVIEKTGSLAGLNNVIRSLSWNFDKDSDDDDSDDDSKDDSDSDDKGDDSDDDNDDDTPDFVDTDDDDDHDRKESSYRYAEEVEDGFVRDLTDESLEPNVVDEVFEGDVNDLESSNTPLRTGKTAAPQHLNPADPGGNPWHTDHYPDTFGDKAYVTPNSMGLVEPSLNGGFDGSYHMNNPTDQDDLQEVHRQNYPTEDHAQAEIEKFAPQVGAPGRHRAASKLPVKPRLAAPQNLNPVSTGTVPGTFPQGTADPLAGIDPTLPKGTFNTNPNYADDYDKQWEQQNRAPVRASRSLPYAPRNAK